MKNKNMIGLVLLSSFIFLTQIHITPITAYDFEGNETYYTKICTGYITDNATQQTCLAYQKYLSEKISNSKDTAANTQARIDALQGDIDKVIEQSKENQNKIKEINEMIAVSEDSIVKQEAAIIETKEKITAQEEKIEKRKQTIAERMVNQQVKVNTNQFIDYIMGAADLVDLIQRSSSLESFTRNDKKQIELINKEVDQLKKDKTELERIQQTLEMQKQSLINSREEIIALEEYNKQLEAIYERQKVELTAQKNAASAAANTASAYMPSMIFGSNGESAPDISSSSFIEPVPGAYHSAGTWAYPGGGTHLGVDRAANIGTPIYAPADAIVLYANNPVADGSGYLGNWSGTPSGGGNTVFLLMSINGQTYAMQFAHMSQNMPAKGRNTVSRGEIIGYIGQTGNSSGPHCHIEVLKINLSVQNAIARWNSTRDWQFGTGWDTPGACSSVACKIRPESLGF